MAHGDLPHVRLPSPSIPRLVDRGVGPATLGGPESAVKGGGTARRGIDRDPNVDQDAKVDPISHGGAPDEAATIDGRVVDPAPAAFERDRLRDGVLGARGFRVLRVTWGQLEAEPEAVLVRAAQMLAQSTGP